MSADLILEEDIGENYVPSESEIKEYAEFLGIDPRTEPHLLWIAKEGIVVPLPENWKPCKTTVGDIYYFNFVTGESLWDHPCDAHYKKKVEEERERYKQGGEPNQRRMPAKTDEKNKKDRLAPDKAEQMAPEELAQKFVGLKTKPEEKGKSKATRLKKKMRPEETGPSEDPVCKPETASDELAVFNPDHPFAKGNSPDEIELKFDRGQSIFPSKAFLAQASPVLGELFKSGNKKSGRQCLEVKGKNYKAFCSMLLNVHPRIQKPLPDDAAKTIYEYAYVYKIPLALNNCEAILLRTTFLNKSKAVENSWDLLTFGEKYHNENLVSKSIEYISTQPLKQITSHPTYSKLSDATKNKILTLRLEKHESK